MLPLREPLAVELASGGAAYSVCADRRRCFFRNFLPKGNSKGNFQGAVDFKGHLADCNVGCCRGGARDLWSGVDSEESCLLYTLHGSEL